MVSGLVQNPTGFSLSLLPNEFTDTQLWPRGRNVSRSAGTNYFCRWANNSRPNTLNAFAARAILSIAKREEGEVAIVKIADGQYAAERVRHNGDISLAVVDSSGHVRAAKLVGGDVSNWQPFPNISQKDADLSPIFAAYMMLLCGNGDILKSSSPVETGYFKDNLDRLEQNGLKDEAAVFFLNSMLYEAFKGEKVKDDIPATNIPSLLTESMVKGMSAGVAICGRPQIFRVTGKVSTAKPRRVLTLGEVLPEFADWAKTRKWTKKEEAMISALRAQYDDDFPIMPEVVSIARRFVKSRGFRRPMNNVLWRGPTSYGKSTGVEILSLLLHAPKLTMTCSSNMETQEFLTNYVPESSSQQDQAGLDRLPTPEEMAEDPETAYERLTGVRRPGVTANEVFEKCLQAVSAQKQGAPRYKLVESNYVKCLRRGYICEIQEISRIKDPGVLVTLNEYDRGGAIVPLADGNFVKRDPLAMVIYTDNVGYRSCHSVDPAVMRRMDFVKDSLELSDEQVIARIKYNTGFSDTSRLAKMMESWKAAINYCKMNDITEGEIGVTELERWVQVLMMEGENSFEDGFFECVVSKATPDREDQALIKQNVIDTLRAGY